MSGERIVWRSELMTATGWTKDHLKKNIKRGKFPKPDIAGVVGDDRKGGKEPGWNIGSLPDDLKKRIEHGAEGIEEKRKEEPEVRSPV